MIIINAFTSNTLYNLARGPFAWAAFALFFAGCLIRTLKVLSLTRKWEPCWNIPVPMGNHNASKVRLPFRMKLTVFGTNPVTMVVSTIFHILIFVLPIFLLAHNILLKDAIGISFFSLPQQMADLLAFIFLGCAVFFFFRRIFLKRMRAISSVDDYLILFIAAAPFLTGVLAFYQIYDYRTVVILHMLSGELMLITIPFTKAFHMVFFFIGRFLIVNQNTMGRGTRIL